MSASVRLTNDAGIPASALLLGVAGVLPFWLATMLLWSNSDPVGPPLASATTIAYGAIILSFLGGIRWGLAIAPGGGRPGAASLALSVLPGLAGFVAMFTPTSIALCILISGFLLHALWDVLAADTGRLPQWFATLRMILTALTVPAILLVLAKLVITSEF